MTEKLSQSETADELLDNELEKISGKLSEVASLLINWHESYIIKSPKTTAERAKKRQDIALACAELEGLPSVAQRHGRQIQLTVGQEEIPTFIPQQHEHEFPLRPGDNLAPGEKILLIQHRSLTSYLDGSRNLYLGEGSVVISVNSLAQALSTEARLELVEAE